jgi:peroxiredoxin
MTISHADTTSPLPHTGRLLPDVALPDTSGGVTRLHEYRQRRPVLVAFLHGPACAECADWLALLAHRRARLDELRVGLLVVLPARLAELRQIATKLDLSFALLADEQGGVAARYGLAPDDHRRVALFAADRYGHLLQSWSAEEASALPPPDAALDAIAFAEMEDCGCGLPAWSPELMADE